MKNLLRLTIVLLLAASCKKEDGPKPTHDPYNHDHPLATADYIKRA